MDLLSKQAPETPYIVIDQPNVATQTVPLNRTVIVLGRSDQCDVTLTADEVSRSHAKIHIQNQRVVLVDQKSMNGTYVNRQRIVERVLSDGDEIWFGSKCRILFRNPLQSDMDKPEGLKPDSSLNEDMDRIRAEMDRVGNSMTLIGQARKPEQAAEPISSATEMDIMKMGRAYRRLAALHKAGQVMASNFDLDNRLGNVLDLTIEVLDANRGFVVLREADGELKVRVARQMATEISTGSPSMGIARQVVEHDEPVLMVNRQTDEIFGSRDSIIRENIQSAMSVPLKVVDRVLGAIYLDTRQDGILFNEEDLELFASMAYQCALAIDNVTLHQKVVLEEKNRMNLGRFLSPAIVNKILNEDSSLVLGGQKTCVTTLFCDIRGSSKLAEQLSPAELVRTLNEHFTAMTEIVFQHQGTLDKYIGDEIMVLFGAPLALEDAPYQAVLTAMAIQQKNQELNHKRSEQGLPHLQLGIGIETGEVIAGYIGSPMRMDFTVVGDRINTAKRLCDMAGPGMIVVGMDTWQSLADRVRGNPLGTLLLKGKDRPVYAYEIVALLDADAEIDPEPTKAKG